MSASSRKFYEKKYLGADEPDPAASRGQSTPRKLTKNPPHRCRHSAVDAPVPSTMAHRRSSSSHHPDCFRVVAKKARDIFSGKSHGPSDAPNASDEGNISERLPSVPEADRRAPRANISRPLTLTTTHAGLINSSIGELPDSTSYRGQQSMQSVQHSLANIEWHVSGTQPEMRPAELPRGKPAAFHHSELKTFPEHGLAAVKNGSRTSLLTEGFYFKPSADEPITVGRARDTGSKVSLALKPHTQDSETASTTSSISHNPSEDVWGGMPSSFVKNSICFRKSAANEPQAPDSQPEAPELPLTASLTHEMQLREPQLQGPQVQEPVFTEPQAFDSQYEAPELSTAASFAHEVELQLQGPEVEEPEEADFPKPEECLRSHPLTPQDNDMIESVRQARQARRNDLVALFAARRERLANAQSVSQAQSPPKVAENQATVQVADQAEHSPNTIENQTQRQATPATNFSRGPYDGKDDDTVPSNNPSHIPSSCPGEDSNVTTNNKQSLGHAEESMANKIRNVTREKLERATAAQALEGRRHSSFEGLLSPSMENLKQQKKQNIRGKTFRERAATDSELSAMFTVSKPNAQGRTTLLLPPPCSWYNRQLACQRYKRSQRASIAVIPVRAPVRINEAAMKSSPTMKFSPTTEPSTTMEPSVIKKQSAKPPTTTNPLVNEKSPATTNPSDTVEPWVTSKMKRKLRHKSSSVDLKEFDCNQKRASEGIGSMTPRQSHVVCSAGETARSRRRGKGYTFLDLDDDEDDDGNTFSFPGLGIAMEKLGDSEAIKNNKEAGRVGAGNLTAAKAFAKSTRSSSRIEKANERAMAPMNRMVLANTSGETSVRYPSGISEARILPQAHDLDEVWSKRHGDTGYIEWLQIEEQEQTPEIKHATRVPSIGALLNGEAPVKRVVKQNSDGKWAMAEA